MCYYLIYSCLVKDQFPDGNVCRSVAKDVLKYLDEQFSFQVVAVAARALENAEKFAKEFDIPRAYGSYKELIDDPDIGECGLEKCYFLMFILKTY